MFCSFAFRMASSAARRVTTKPNPQWPLTRAVVGVSPSISVGAPGTMWPFRMRST